MRRESNGLGGVFAFLWCTRLMAMEAAPSVAGVFAARHVVRATVTSSEAVWARDGSGASHIYTNYVAAVQETLKGPGVNNELTLRVPAGRSATGASRSSRT